MERIRSGINSGRKSGRPVQGLSPGCRNRARKEQQPFPNRKKSQSFTVIDLPFDAYCDTKGFIIPFSTVVDREKARRCPFYAPSGFLYEIGNVVWAIYPEIFLNFLFRTLGR